MIPSYIENAGVVGAPIDCEYKGYLHHIGPVETVNKRFRDISLRSALEDCLCSVENMQALDSLGSCVA